MRRLESDLQDTETALPDAPEVVASGQPDETLTQTEGTETKQEGEEQKPEKTPEEREKARMQRAIDRKTRMAAEAKAEAAQARRELEELRARANGGTNRTEQDDSESVSLSRAELQRLIDAEAEKRAPKITEQKAEIEHRRSIVTSLAKEWGQERFDELASDLDDSFGGLADANGKPKPATDAIFEADNPAALIEYLADPENAAEAEALGRMNDRQAGRAIALLETKLKAAKDTKPKPSGAPKPIEALRGAATGTSEPDESKMTDLQWARYQEQKRSKR